MTAILFLQAPITYSRYATGSQARDGDTDPVAAEWLRLGVRAALENNREDARYYFVQAVRTDLDFARAWLYLGGVADDPALTLSCMQKVLQLQPNEPQAWKGLIWAREKLGLLQLPLPMVPTPPIPVTPDVLRAPPFATTPLPLPVPARPVPPAGPPPAGPIRRLTLLPAPRARPAAPPPITLRPAAVPAAPPTPRPGALPTSTSAARVATPVARAPVATVPPVLVAPWAPAPDRPALLPAGTDGESGETILSDIARKLVRRGTAAAAAGDRGHARYYFLKAIAADSSNTRAWLYLGGVAEDPSLTLACMERVLRAEPANIQAQVGAEWARSKLGLPLVPLGWWD